MGDTFNKFKNTVLAIVKLISKNSKKMTVNLLESKQNVIKAFLKACVFFLSNFYYSSNNSPSKTMKNVFYFN